MQTFLDLLDQLNLIIDPVDALLACVVFLCDVKLHLIAENLQVLTYPLLDLQSDIEIIKGKSVFKLYFKFLNLVLKLLNP